MSVATNAAAASDAVGTISTSNGGFRTAVKGQNGLPLVTTSSSEEYLEACARSNEKASRNDPLTLLFQAERLPPLQDEPMYTDENGLLRPTYSALRKRLAQCSEGEIETSIYESSIYRIRYKASIGAFVAEAGNWSATTTWEPVFAPPHPAEVEKDAGNTGGNTATPDGSTSEPWLAVMESLVTSGKRVSDIYNQRPIFAEFLTRIEMARRKHLYPLLWRSKHTDSHGRKFDEHTEKAFAMVEGHLKHLLFWHLSVTSRNPAVQPPVPGAVRAVIEPFVKKWVDELGMPVVWLEAGSARARDVYSYFGFRVVEEITVGEDDVGNTIKTWCMAYTRKP